VRFPRNYSKLLGIFPAFRAISDSSFGSTELIDLIFEHTEQSDAKQRITMHYLKDYLKVRVVVCSAGYRTTFVFAVVRDSKIRKIRLPDK